MDQRIEDFLAYLLTERSLSPNTVSAYRNDLSQFVEYLDAEATRQGSSGFALATIDRERIAGFLLYLRERGYSAASLARKVAAIKSFFQYLHQRGEVPANPTIGLGSPEVKKTLPQTVGASDLQTLLDFARQRESPEGLRDHAMLRLLSATGMRVSELVALNLEHIDMEQATILCAGRNGRNRRQRVLPLSALALEQIKNYLQHARPRLIHNHPGEQALFVNHHGERLTRQGFWLIIKGYARQAGITGITPHMLRHSFAILMLQKGKDLRSVQELMGHAHIATTQIYSQLARESIKTTV
jgi:integrase/recombinase XerD